jgi:succinylarginine dihydrolase
MVTEPVKEVIFVGLPGPTHNYGGLSTDNVASSLNRGNVSNPRQAALQALDLVRLMRRLGIETGILPPQLRPHLPTLRQHFSGSPEAVIAQAAREKPALLEKMCSSSAMWTANAATISPAIDNADHRLHLTVANLQTNLHRRIEAGDTYRVLSAIFAQVPGAVVHPPLPAAEGYRDEGAANHMRLLPRHDGKGLHVFVYGTDGSPDDPLTARQTLSAFQAIKKQHGIADNAALFIKQNPAVIREGVFHNDVIAVSNESVLLAHEAAYANGRTDIERIAASYEALHGAKLTAIMITGEDLAVDEAVHTYFFNSQIVTKPDGRMAIIAPSEVESLYAGKAARLLKQICKDASNPIDEIHIADLRQSMNNGGGPACLRLRVPMTGERVEAIRRSVNVMAGDALLDNLQNIIEAHYPQEVQPSDIADPALYFRCERVLGELGALMKLPLLPE